MDSSLRYLESSDLYIEVMERRLQAATTSVWIATANVKNLRLRAGNRVISIVALLERLTRKRVDVRLLHAAALSRPFQRRFQRSKLQDSVRFQRVQCPRVHFKIVLIDGVFAYTGSANLTGAGLGMRSEQTRNFEVGFTTAEPALIRRLTDFYDFVWRGEMCPDCGRRDICPAPIQ